MSAGKLQCDDQLILPTSLMGQSVESNDVAWFPVTTVERSPPTIRIQH
jgi:hypothetical protein